MDILASDAIQQAYTLGQQSAQDRIDRAVEVLARTRGVSLGQIVTRVHEAHEILKGET